MKEKITCFIVGLLLGAIISTASIYVYSLTENDTNTSNNTTQNTMENRGTPPEMPNGSNQGGPINNQGTSA